MVYKKINYVLILLALSTLLLGGCRKSKEYTEIEFVIINPANNEPFVGIPVRIAEEKSGMGGITGETVFEAVTDANGRAYYKFKAKKTSKFWYYPYIDYDSFGVQGKDYSILVRPEVSSYTVKKDEYNEMRYEITYYAYLKLKIKNIVCEGLEDTLVYHAWTPDFKGGGGAYDYITTLSGCVDYETTGSVDNHPAGYAHVYMGWHKIEWEARKPSGITYGIDSVYIDKGGFGTTEVLY